MENSKNRKRHLCIKFILQICRHKQLNEGFERDLYFKEASDRYFSIRNILSSYFLIFSTSVLSWRKFLKQTPLKANLESIS